MMIDTHCHLDQEDYLDVELVINNMEKNIMIASGCNAKTNRRVIELINKYELDDMTEENLNYIEENINNCKMVGIGEIGLDYHWDKDNKEKQKEYFIKQIELAKKYNKPIVIHSRDAGNDTLAILKDNLGKSKAVMHCYSYSLELANEFKKMGIKFGIGGVLTLKNSIKLKEVVKELEMTDLLLETDSPYLSPEPFRGKKNEPKNIYYVAEEIGKLKDISTEEVLKITTQNAVELFDLDITL